MTEDSKRQVGAEIYGSGKTFFDDVAMDNLMEAFLELTATVWTYHDRNIVLEHVLQDFLAKNHNLDLDELIEQHKPSDEQKETRKREREEMINRIFQSFHKRPK